jgi:SOS response regulatory protein OraA/RecX
MTSKQFQKYQKDMTTAIDLIAQRSFAHEEGFNEGKKEERERILRRLLQSGMSPEQIQEILKDPESAD